MILNPQPKFKAGDVLYNPILDQVLLIVRRHKRKFLQKFFMYDVNYIYMKNWIWTETENKFRICKKIGRL
jgi:hypothetical protein